MDDTEDERDLTTLVESGNVNRGSSSDTQDDEEEYQTSSQVRGVVPGSWDVGEFGQSSSNHDQGSDGTTESSHGPEHRCRRLSRTTNSIDGRRVVSRVEPED